MSNAALLSPEARLLLLALADPLRPERLGAVLREPELDWSRLVLLAEKEKATSTLWKALRRLPDGTVPPERAAQLGRLAAIGDFRMMRQEQLLRKALDVLAGVGIEVVLLKGAGLAATVYGSFTERPMYDLDLLVRREDAGRAWDALRRAGWTHDEVACPPGFYESHHHLPPLDDPGGTGLAIELHTEPWAGAVELSSARMWEGSRTVEIGGRRTRVPAVGHQILHLATHFAWAHVLRSAAWRTIRDLQRLLASGAVDWDEVVGLAVASRGATCCYWTFAIARSLADVPVPDRVLAALRPPLPGAALRVLERHYVGAVFHFSPARCPSLNLDRLLWCAGIAPRWSGHGQTRPWTRDPELAALRGAATPARLRDQLRNNVARASEWSRYLRALATAPRAP